jgi:hypothetical protein
MLFIFPLCSKKYAYLTFSLPPSLECVNDQAACNSNLRSTGFPNFVIPPYLSVSPEQSTRGTSPAYAATCPAVANRLPSPTYAKKAVTTFGPIPGTDIKYGVSSCSAASLCSSSSNCAMFYSAVSISLPIAIAVTREKPGSSFPRRSRSAFVFRSLPSISVIPACTYNA